ncbi:hypothetical protein [Chamaesiphon minutus]|nr:hypothetical protein [Chamaesiphon minutus]
MTGAKLLAIRSMPRFYKVPDLAPKIPKLFLIIHDRSGKIYQ